MVAEQPLQPDLSLGRVHDVDTAYDLRNAFELVVHNDRQLVGDKAIPAPDNEVAGLGLKALSLLALQGIGEGDWLVVGA